MVFADDERSGLYYDEPAVIAQFFSGVAHAQFEAKWLDGEWKLESGRSMRSYPFPNRLDLAPNPNLKHRAGRTVDA